MTSVFSWQNSVSLCPASFCTPRPNLLVTSGISWLPTFAFHGLCSQSYMFSSSHVWMWELDHKEGWAPKSWCFWTVVLEKTLESLLDCKEIKPVHPKGNQPWIFIGRTDAEVEAPIFDHLMMQRANSLEKTLMLGKIEGRGEGDNRGWDSWMASLTQWTWVWASSGRWWRTGKPGVLQTTWSQRVGHNLATEQQPHGWNPEDTVLSEIR